MRLLMKIQKEKGTIRRKCKPKKSLLAVFFIIFLFGVILLILPFFIQGDDYSETRSNFGSGGFGHGPFLKPGDEIEIKYHIGGEEAEVYLTKGFPKHHRNDDENVLVYIPNASSGTIKYTVEEEDFYVLYFEGRDFTVDYTYKVRNFYDNLGLIFMGILFIFMGVTMIWGVLRGTNPRYFGSKMKYYSLIFIIMGIVMLMLGLIIYKFPLLLGVSIGLIFGSVIPLIQNKPNERNYIFNLLSSPNDAVKEIKRYLKVKKIEFNTVRSVRERMYLWHTVFTLKDLGIKIKVLKMRPKKRRTMIFLGKQTEQNRIKLIRLANNVANRLRCDNYKPISE